LQEISTSPGYLLDETVHEVGASPSLYEIELNTTENTLPETVIRGNIQLVITSLAAYAFARLRFIGRKYGLMSLLVLQVFPNSMAVAGYYILIYRFGLVDKKTVARRKRRHYDPHYRKQHQYYGDPDYNTASPERTHFRTVHFLSAKHLIHLLE